MESFSDTHAAALRSAFPPIGLAPASTATVSDTVFCQSNMELEGLDFETSGRDTVNLEVGEQNGRALSPFVSSSVPSWHSVQSSTTPLRSRAPLASAHRLNHATLRASTETTTILNRTMTLRASTSTGIFRHPSSLNPNVAPSFFAISENAPILGANTESMLFEASQKFPRPPPSQQQLPIYDPFPGSIASPIPLRDHICTHSPSLNPSAAPSFFDVSGPGNAFAYGGSGGALQRPKGMRKTPSYPHYRSNLAHTRSLERVQKQNTFSPQYKLMSHIHASPSYASPYAGHRTFSPLGPAIPTYFMPNHGSFGYPLLPLAPTQPVPYTDMLHASPAQFLQAPYELGHGPAPEFVQMPYMLQTDPASTFYYYSGYVWRLGGVHTTRPVNVAYSAPTPYVPNHPYPRQSSSYQGHRFDPYQQALSQHRYTQQQRQSGL